MLDCFNSFSLIVVSFPNSPSVFCLVHSSAPSSCTFFHVNLINLLLSPLFLFLLFHCLSASPLFDLFVSPSIFSLTDEIDMLERLWLSGICHNDKIEVRRLIPLLRFSSSTCHTIGLCAVFRVN